MKPLQHALSASLLALSFALMAGAAGAAEPDPASEAGERKGKNSRKNIHPHLYRTEGQACADSAVGCAKAEHDVASDAKTNSPGHKSVGDITLRGAMTDRNAESDVSVSQVDEIDGGLGGKHAPQCSFSRDDPMMRRACNDDSLPVAGSGTGNSQRRVLPTVNK